MTNKLPALRKAPSHSLLPKITPKHDDNLADASLINRSDAKYQSQLANPLPVDSKFKTLSRTQAVEGLKTLSLLGRQHDLAAQTIEDSHRASQTRLKPLERTLARADPNSHTQKLAYVKSSSLGGN